MVLEEGEGGRERERLGEDAAKREKRDQTIPAGRSPFGCGDHGGEHGNTVFWCCFAPAVLALAVAV